MRAPAGHVQAADEQTSLGGPPIDAAGGGMLSTVQAELLAWR
jgi:hypothetical protein